MKVILLLAQILIAVPPDFPTTEELIQWHQEYKQDSHWPCASIGKRSSKRACSIRLNFT